MTKKTRTIILLVCILSFSVIAPLLVLYSMGDRFDFMKMKITATGGIYVRTFPSSDQITIDNKITGKPGLFANSIFVQSLLPSLHTVLIKKAGYFDYFKTLPVVEKEVTKLENVMLIKNNIELTKLAGSIIYFSVAPNNQNILTQISGTKNISLDYFSLNSTNKPQSFFIAQTGTVSDIKWADDSSKALIKIQSSGVILYYLFDTAFLPQTTATVPVIAQKPVTTHLMYLDKNSQQISFNPQDSKTIFYVKNNILYSAKGITVLPTIKNIYTYKISGGNIVWLSANGLLNSSNISGELAGQLATTKIASAQNYKIFFLSGKTFVQADNSLFLLNPEAKTLETVVPPENNYKIVASGDGKNLIYWNNEKIYLYSFTDKKYQELFSNTNITNCQWLNNDYIIFTAEDKTIISEIDYRGNINQVTLPQTATISTAEKIDIKTPQTFFNQSEGKLYLLTNNVFLSSEKITPQ